jgi:hypothetical protein
MTNSCGALTFANGSFGGYSALRRAIRGNGTWLFSSPNSYIHTACSQEPVAVTFETYPNTTVPGVPTGNVIRRYYRITSSGNLTGDLRLAYVESELNGIREDDLTLFRCDGGPWVNEGGTINPVNNWIELADVSSWCDRTLGDITHPLPIQLANFSAVVRNGNNVELQWNNYGFHVQRRNSVPEDYVDVPNSFIPGHGTTTEPHDYAWTHQGVVAGICYYRLKQVDLDGTVHFSDGRQVTISSPTGVTGSSLPAAFILAQNYPNPFNPSTQIQFTVETSGHTSLTVFDILGKEVGTLFAGVAEPGRLYSVSFDASGVTNGTYFYKLMKGDQTSLKKMVLLK